jgi:hypothetical protein
MKKDVAHTRLKPSELGVVGLGALGIVVLARTAQSYAGTDALALSLVVVMSVGFVLGIVELLMRSRRAQRIQGEVAALPTQASEESVEAASPELRAFLRARIEQATHVAGREAFTPYLVGLMVMLGLLGTLLGLFETLNGAGRALTESTNVDALRNGLSGPMRGLTRSFGCSAAGVAASALLGLAAVLTRRSESRASALVHAYANGPLRALSPVRKQLDAIGKLASQSEAWPRAADALSQASGQIGELAERWERAHTAASTVQREMLEKTIVALREDLGKSAAQMAASMHEAVAPMVKQTVTQAGEAASKHVSSVMDAFERDLKARRAADDELRRLLNEQLATLRKAAETDAKARFDTNEKQSAAFEATLRRQAEEQTVVLARHRDEAQGQVAAIGEAARALREQLEREASARRAEATALLDSLGQRMDASAAERAAESRTQLEAIGQLAEQLVREFDAREQTVASRWETMLDKLEQARLRGATADAERTEQLATRLSAQQSALLEGWSTLSQRIHEASEESRAHDEQRLNALAQATHVLSHELARTVQSVEQTLGARALADAEQAERGKNAVQGLLALSQTLQDSLAKQEQAVLRLLEEGGRQLAQAGGSAQVQAEAALTRIVELASAQAERFAELETSLQANQSAHTKALADELALHADRLSKGLEGTTAIVREASDLLKVSGVELSAVAEMFAKSVTSQRETAAVWLENMGELEGAIERAGRSAAADALGDQLASTQEVFARQLQFQRELFEQLRSLRGAGPAAARVEQTDVSA